eukprot:3162026-Amphidinium_carterae.1
MPVRLFVRRVVLMLTARPASSEAPATMARLEGWCHRQRVLRAVLNRVPSTPEVIALEPQTSHIP